ncbi:hypothetical protein ONE63_011300 [Megalurothrips usitatus]|uniref:GAG-pre-integrase domain-containing protein n=1 Tax=Megalurothrips usitatus TaxID=439358 RepID=A0AAV7X3C4_9NEOP|nr:hypothetical protein ONE63_011300 [Megalurothrips usitatus]
MGVWVMDSGATHHMCPFKELFSDLDERATGTVRVANGAREPVKGKGSVTIIMHEESGGWKITFQKVMYVPGLHSNLISIHQLDNKGLGMKIHHGCFSVFEDNNIVLFKAIASKDSNVYLVRVKEYEVNGGNVQCTAFSAVESEMRAFNAGALWHKRFGHLKGIPDQCKAPKEFSECDACHQGKMKKLPPALSSNRGEGPIELVHSDVAGPILPTTAGGSKYVVTFLDDFSRPVNGIPIELWHGKSLNLSDLNLMKVFGCKAFALCDKKSKIEPRGIECIFLGCEEGSKAYRVWDIVNEKVIVSRHVTFIETKFPYHQPNLIHQSGEVGKLEIDGFPFDSSDDDVQQPMYTEEEPVIDEPVIDEPVIDEPVIDEPVIDEPVIDEPVIDEPVIDEPVIDEPVNPVRSSRVRKHKKCSCCLVEEDCCLAEESEDESCVSNVPQTVKEALSRGDAERWKVAIENEMLNHEKNRTWTLVPRPEDVNVIGCRMVFNVKSDGTYKARLVALGYRQIKGV